ncbi:hypothetical protein LINPERHAP2_LOCUS30665 [Linum perenne]
MSPAISSPKSSSGCLCPPFSASANSPHNGGPQSTAHSSKITKSSTPPPPPETQLQPYSSLIKNRTSCPRTTPPVSIAQPKSTSKASTTHRSSIQDSLSAPATDWSASTTKPQMYSSGTQSRESITLRKLSSVNSLNP